MMKPAEFIALCASCMMLTAVGIDVMLPAFASIRQDFALGEHFTDTAYIVTSFFWGQLFQLFFGPLSDRIGRIPVLRIGFLLYIAGSLAAAFSNNLPQMLVARFIAGTGAAAVFMTIVAMVRDRFEGDQMARVMSFIFTLFLFTPVVAPFLGLAILRVSDWRVVFLAPPVFAIIVFGWSLRMKETLPPERRSSVKLSRQLRVFGSILRNGAFIRYTGTTTLLFGGLSAYVSSAEFIVSDHYGKPALFPWIFGAIGLVMAGGALINTRLVTIFGARKTLNRLLLVYVAVAIVLLAGTILLAPLPPIFFFFSCIALLLGINLAVEPNSSSLALQDLSAHAGTASALYGTCFFFGGALIGTAISKFLSTSLLSMPVGFVAIGIAALWLAHGSKKNDNL